MAYPTDIDFKIVSPNGVGAQKLDETSTTQNHPLGMRVTGRDFGAGARGEAEFVYGKGVASTVAGDVVILDSKGADTTRIATTSRGPVGVAMSANVASQYGWYATRGVVPVSAAGTVAANAALYATATAGEVDDAITAGAKIDGMVSQAADSADFLECLLTSPAMVGNGDASGN